MTEPIVSTFQMNADPQPQSTARPMRSRRRVLFLFVLFAVGFGLAELSARAWVAMGGADHAAEYAWHRNKRLSHTWAEQDREHPYLPYVPRVKPPDVTMRDLRLASAEQVKPDDVFRIFCLGGSTTWYGYPRELQEELAHFFSSRGKTLEVVNAANVSWTSAESLVNFSLRCLPYEPDAVIVYHAVNDCWPAFGKNWSPDYSHWRKRLIVQEPFVWDYVPRVLDASAAYVQFRSWFEIPQRYRQWKTAMMRYVPDFEEDPYHGVEPYRRNIGSLLAIAEANNIPVFLSTQVYNHDEPRKRLVMAVQDVNEITRELAASSPGVAFVDAASSIRGTDEILYDICHFRKDRDGQKRLVELFASAIQSHIVSLDAAPVAKAQRLD